MILAIVYAVLLATLLGLAARSFERIAEQLAWPRRYAWMTALVASIALPTWALIAEPGSSSSAIVSLPQPIEIFSRALPPTDFEVTATASRPDSWLSWPDWAFYNSALKALWIASSVLTLALCVIAGLGLARLARRSVAATIGEQSVLVSEDIGPAVFGILKPRIILPRWLAEQESRLRALVLDHEREHIAARDQLSLILALAIVAVMPWNPALWWQLRRLRAAIEVDCDARVLSKGADPRDYSEALLTVGQLHTATPFGAVALTEPVSELEQRIRIMLERSRKFSLAVVGSRSALLVTAAGLALALNAPNAQQSEIEEQSSPGDDSGQNEPKVIPTISTAVYERLTAAQECMDAEDTACARRILDEVGEQPDLNGYETASLYNFNAFLSFEEDDFDGATHAYESILSLPHDVMPNGLIQQSMRNVATLYLQQERYQDGLDSFNEYLNLPWVEPSADDIYLKATVHYQMEDYDAMLPTVREAIASTDEPKEKYYQLLYVGQFQTDDIAGAVETLEVLNARWPSEQWANALEGLSQSLE